MIERVKTLKIKNFRGFKGEHIFNLDADIILLSGKNGVGKSTIIYALDRLLNGYSKNGILSRIGENIISVDSDGSFAIQINGEKDLSNKEEFFTSKDDTYSRLYELGSIFYQEYFGDIGLPDILRILSGDLSTIQFKHLLRDIKDSFIPQLKRDYLPTTIDVFERRREFFTKWKGIIDELKKYKQFRDIKQNFLFDNKGTPNFIENQFYNFLIDTSEKLGGHKDYKNLNKNDFLEILRNLRDVLNKLAFETEKNKSESSTYDNDAMNQLHKYTSHKVMIFNEKINILQSDNTLYVVLNDEQLLTLEKELDTRKTELEKLNKEIEKIRDSLNKWAIPGQTPFKEVVDTLSLYVDNINGLEKLYYPNEVVSWLRKISQELNNILSSFHTWYKDMENKLEQKVKNKDQLLQYLKILNENIEFNKLILKTYLKNKIFDKLNENNSVLLADIIGINLQEQKRPLKDVISNAIDLLNSQIDRENELKNEIEFYKTDRKQKKIEEIIEYSDKLIKKELGKNSIILSNTEIIPAKKLKELIYTLNSILRFFHFPPEFLDIKIINVGTKTKPKYTFATSKGKELNYNNLSTGQKNQLAIAWTIGLNYLLSKKLPHKVIMFDDVTTSLDLAQLIPASILFRKMAYSDSKNRQVIISSHHDDLTNRLVDFLMPPPKKSLKVIYFEDWSLEKGPKYKEYMVKSNDNNWLNTNFYKKKIKELKNYLEGNYEL